MNYFSSNKFITVNLKGGIGNQLFQIATAYGLAKALDLTFVIFRGQFEGCNQGSHPLKYYDNFYRGLQIIDPIPITHVIKERQWTAYAELKDEVASAAKADQVCIQLDGYFQSEYHFEDLQQELCKMLLSGIDHIHELPSDFDPESSVLIGVRRGDYVERAHIHNPCGMTYYSAAMNIAQGQIPVTKYFIVSDDLAWARKNFIGDNFVFLDIEDDLKTLLVLIKFKRFIISNSSFYWWGSYLAEATQVIAPDKWIFGSAAPPQAYWSIYRKDMIVIERPVETV